MSFLKIIRWIDWPLVGVALFGLAGVILGWLEV